MAEKLLGVKELRAMPEPELRLHLEKLRHDLWETTRKIAEGSSLQTHLPSRTRRQIARAATILREGERATLRKATQAGSIMHPRHGR